MEGRPSYKCILYGSVTADRDKISEDTLPELKYGEWVYFENAGAYSSNFYCDINGFKIPSRHYILEEKDRCIINFIINCMLLHTCIILLNQISSCIL